MIKEKVALVFLCVLLVRMINDDKLGLNFYIPMSLTHYNFKKISKRNSFVK